jgi:copper homeostasis protein (lipoprotein)
MLGAYKMRGNMKNHTLTGLWRAIAHSYRHVLAAWTLVALAWLFCSPVWADTLKGTAAYREYIKLPDDVVFEAELQDISIADVPAAVLGRSKLDPAGQPPFRFEIAYNGADIRRDHRYTVCATIKHQGRLLFTTDRIYPVLDSRNAPLQILLVSVDGGTKGELTDDDIGVLPASFKGELPGAGGPIVWHVDLLPEGRYRLRTTYMGKPEPNRFDDIGRWAQDASGRIVLRGGREAPVFLMPVDGGTALLKLDLHGKSIESDHNDRLMRLPEPRLIEPQLLLTGMFTYMADAATITLCIDGQQLPVAMEGDYRALETAYQKATSQPGQPLLVSLEGLITQRPSKESRPPQTTLVVERFIAVWPRESCGNMLADSPLGGTY